ncbi:Peroxisome membrane anchor protein Pex14p N-terminal domain-containing protein [Entamoeba marina]
MTSDQHELYQRALKLLKNPSVQNIPNDSIKSFLINKGLNNAVVNQLLNDELLHYKSIIKPLGISVMIGSGIIGIYYLLKNFIKPYWQKRKDKSFVLKMK